MLDKPRLRAFVARLCEVEELRRFAARERVDEDVLEVEVLLPGDERSPPLCCVVLGVGVAALVVVVVGAVLGVEALGVEALGGDFFLPLFAW